VEAGCPEVVLTGIHIGTYGFDLGSGITLTEMIGTLLSARGRTRIRLSSIEPREITEEMLGFLGNGLCRHLHIPLQSGDDAILASMKRNYTSGFYQGLLEKISKQVPGTALGADVMVGFPGEGDKEFNNTLQLIEASPLTHLHVFSFSPRPGTPAAEMMNQVPEQVKKERNQKLRDLGRRKNFEFRNKCVGTELCAVVEDKVDANTGCFTGLTDNYIRLRVSGSKREHIGKEITVRVKQANYESNYADIL
jgi:threonylcarbamoyladenosine tRNA methylthiotransferase MtaB